MYSTLKTVVAVLILSVATTAHAWWQVNATWQIGGAAPTYSATGSTKETALANARAICRQSQPLDEYKYYCLNGRWCTINKFLYNKCLASGISA